MDNPIITFLCLFVICVSLFTIDYTKTKDGDNDPDYLHWGDDTNIRIQTQPQDLSVCIDEVSIMSFSVDPWFNLTGIKILTQDTGYYSEDGNTYYLCINGVKVEGSEFCMD